MSPREFDGWTPTEVHEQFDADGNRTGHTVITREPVWDETDRARAYALADYEDSKCGCGCGVDIGDALDPERAFIVDTFTCYAGRALRQIERRDSDEAERRGDPEGAADGVHYYVRAVDPDD